MVTILLEVLHEARSSQQRYKTVRYPGRDLSIAAQDMCLQEEEETKAGFKAEAPESLTPDKQQKGKQGLQHRVADRAFGVIFSPPASFLKPASDSLLRF